MVHKRCPTRGASRSGCQVGRHIKHLKFGREARAGDNNLGIISVQVVVETMGAMTWGQALGST